jgi:hypothetical protein
MLMYLLIYMESLFGVGDSGVVQVLKSFLLLNIMIRKSLTHYRKKYEAIGRQYFGYLVTL